MKNVLFATTALVAMTGSAMAASHGMSGASVAFSGEMSVGYNDAIELGMFYDANVDVAATVDFGDNVVATLTAGIASGNETGSTLEFTPTIEIAYTGGSYSASLKVGDMDDKGASEYFYKDRSGMALDVENQDDGTHARALVEFGNFGVAVGCDLAGTNTCVGMNVGAGATFGSIKLGVGYDDAATAGGARTAVSADATFGSFDLGVSYITDNTDNSIGLTVGTTFGAAKVKGYYAMNSNAAVADGFGVSVDYTSGALSLGAYLDNVDDGTATATAVSTYGLDLGYAVSDALTASVGVQAGPATVYYAGIEYAVNSNISATVSYATADAISGPEFKDGITAMITASF